jgi:YfiH family protein
VWTDRHGGVSAAPFDDANLSVSVGDDPESVAVNRRSLAERLGLCSPEEWCWLRQVHGAVVVAGDPVTARPRSEPPRADAAVTTRPGVPLVVQTADCVPVALVGDDAVGVVHAGWVGLLAGVVEAAVTRMRAVGTGAVRAALGPCIHPADYEFGQADLDRVAAALGSSVQARTSEGAPALDLPAAVQAALARAGVTDVLDVDVCTFRSDAHFSYRRDGTTGRQALVAVLDG